jgi:hypothetical protein
VGRCVAVAASVYVSAAAAALVHAPPAFGASAHYRGKTSQHQSISFVVSGGYLRRLDFRIDDRCPSGHLWRIHDFHFPKVKITHSRFDQKFRATDGNATAEIKGTASRNRVTGTLIDRSFISSEHHYCRGSATFRLSR